jgi:hypothetical protein
VLGLERPNWVCLGRRSKMALEFAFFEKGEHIHYLRRNFWSPSGVR